MTPSVSSQPEVGIGKRTGRYARVLLLGDFGVGEEGETVAQLSARYQVHHGQIQGCKKALTEGA